MQTVRAANMSSATLLSLTRGSYLAAVEGPGLTNLESSTGVFTCTSVISYTSLDSLGPSIVQREGILTPLTGQ